MRFVVLHHTDWPGRPDHYDLLLQTEAGRNDDDPVLAAFSTVADAFPDPAEGSVKLTRIHPHRRAYLRYEGPLSRGRGQVERVEEGEMNSFSKGADDDELQIELRGHRLRGKYQVRRLSEEEYAFEKPA